MTAGRLLTWVCGLSLLLPAQHAYAGKKKDDPSRGVPRNVVEGNIKGYTSDAYVVGVGHGNDRESARMRALQSIAQQISSTIDASATVNDAYTTTVKDRESSTLEVLDYRSEAEITSHFDRAEQVRVVETRKGKNAIWVVAALDRAKAAAAARGALHKLREDFESRLNRHKEGVTFNRLAQRELRDIRRRAEREWAMMGAYLGETSVFPDVFRELEGLEVQAPTTLSFCIAPDGRSATDLQVADALQATAQAAAAGWETCDRDNNSVPTLNGLLKAELRPNPDGQGRQCRLDLSFRVVLDGEDLGRGKTGGGPTRATGKTDLDACSAAVEKLYPLLKQKLDEL
ncbi:MAG: hypothetical protein ACON5B_17160 [Myxococcota bacterium]